MSKGEVLITGSDGTIGSVLCGGLTGYDIRRFDITHGNDATNYSQVLAAATDCTAMIHLAWPTRLDRSRATVESYAQHHGNAISTTMLDNALIAAEQAGVRRVILASSLHADMPNREPGGVRSPYRMPEPATFYGIGKVAVEMAGRMFARRNSAVVCIRFGRVFPDQNERLPSDSSYAAGRGWLSHEDCVGLVGAILDAPEVPGNFAIVNGVSRREQGSALSLENPFEWEPQTTYTA